MSAPALREPVESLDALLRTVLDQMGLTASDATHDAALDCDGEWTSRLKRALPVLGLRTHWLHGSADMVLKEARPDLPLVTWLEDPTGGRWVMVWGRRLGRVRVTTIGWGDKSLWIDPVSAFGKERRTWARILPVLPAAPLSATQGQPKSPIRRLWALMRAEQDDIGVVVVLAVAIGVLSLATPLAIQLLINWLAFGALLQPIITLGIGLMLCLTLVGVLRAAQRHAVEIVQRRILARTVADLSARLARVRIESFDKNYGPELANRFFDVLTLQKAASTLLLDGLAAALQATVGLLVLALYHPLLLVFDMVVVAMVAAVLIPLARGAQASAIVESKKKYAIAAWLEELARSPLAFKFAGPYLAESRTDRLTHQYLEARETHFSVFFRQYLGMQLIAMVIPAALLVMTGWLVLRGQLTLGQLVAAEFIVTTALMGVAKFIEKLETVYDLLAGVDKLGNLFDLPLENTHGAPTSDTKPAAAFRLDEVSFAFPGMGQVLTNVSLSVAPGKTVAIYGAHGSGKSVLGEIMVGARRPLGGMVLRDGVPAESFRPSDLYQETVLLRADGIIAGSVRDNLTLGRSVPDSELWALLESLNLAAVVRKLDGGLDATLMPHGRPLSDIQCRALLVTRALVLRPRLIVVDGVLDGLPSSTGDAWLTALFQPAAPWTLILLTADAPLAASCTDIFELKEGTLHVRPRLTTV